MHCQCGHDELEAAKAEIAVKQDALMFLDRIGSQDLPLIMANYARLLAASRALVGAIEARHPGETWPGMATASRIISELVD